MTFGTLKKKITLQWYIKLTLFDHDGNKLDTEHIKGGDNINICVSRRWDSREVKYMFAGDDGFLHIDFEEGD